LVCFDTNVFGLICLCLQTKAWFSQHKTHIQLNSNLRFQSINISQCFNSLFYVFFNSKRLIQRVWEAVVCPPLVSFLLQTERKKMLQSHVLQVIWQHKYFQYLKHTFSELLCKWFTGEIKSTINYFCMIQKHNCSSKQIKTCFILHLSEK